MLLMSHGICPFCFKYINLAWVWDVRGRKIGNSERSLCVVKCAFLVFSVLQIDVIIFLEWRSRSYFPADFLCGCGQSVKYLKY